MGRPFGSKPQANSQAVPEDSKSDPEASIIRDGDLAYVWQTAGNGASDYPEAVGASVETRSLLGYHVNWLIIIFLNLNHMVGTGILSTPATILRLVDSVCLALVYWAIRILLAVAGFTIHMESTSHLLNRSGSAAVWLEQGFPRPKNLFPVAFAKKSMPYYNLTAVTPSYSLTTSGVLSVVTQTPGRSRALPLQLLR